MQEKPFIEEVVEMVLEPKLSNDDVSILILKSITKKKEEGLKLNLVGHFVGIRPPQDMIKSWMKARWSIKGWVSLVSLPIEFVLFKF